MWAPGTRIGQLTEVKSKSFLIQIIELVHAWDSWTAICTWSLHNYMTWQRHREQPHQQQMSMTCHNNCHHSLSPSLSDAKCCGAPFLAESLGRDNKCTCQKSAEWHFRKVEFQTWYEVEMKLKPKIAGLCDHIVKNKNNRFSFNIFLFIFKLLITLKHPTWFIIV